MANYEVLDPAKYEVYDVDSGDALDCLSIISLVRTGDDFLAIYENSNGNPDVLIAKNVARYAGVRRKMVKKTKYIPVYKNRQNGGLFTGWVGFFDTDKEARNVRSPSGDTPISVAVFTYEEEA